MFKIMSNLCAVHLSSLCASSLTVGFWGCGQEPQSPARELARRLTCLMYNLLSKIVIMLRKRVHCEPLWQMIKSETCFKNLRSCGKMFETIRCKETLKNNETSQRIVRFHDWIMIFQYPNMYSVGTIHHFCHAHS